jgi:hypothetical protein
MAHQTHRIVGVELVEALFGDAAPHAGLAVQGRVVRMHLGALFIAQRRLQAHHFGLLP